jgi:hypothetical protein
MPSFLARSVTTVKWKERDIGGRTAVPAHGITNDIRVTEDRLSFWTCDPSHPPSLEHPSSKWSLRWPQRVTRLIVWI